jgi:hypothetical protein
MGTIADIAGLAQYPLTQPCAPITSPSCANLQGPPQIRSIEDEVPFIDLGSFDVGEIKDFDVALKFTFGDQRGGTVPVSAYSFTASPFGDDGISVPEPVSGITVALVGSVVLLLQQRRKDNNLARLQE